MTYDKSLKLLNYAQTDNNNLKLYTELDHSFKLGDRVYIVGGFYDNVSGIVPNDPFSVNYYTVIDVDYNKNSFTIDYTIQPISDLTYPYTKKNGAVGWESSDPYGTDAYNRYDDDEIYKHVYVSRCVFNAGIFNAGIINNGIFGTDDNRIHVSCHISNVNDTSIPTDNVKITHFVSKNIEITKGIVISKTANVNIATRKFRVVEDKTISLTNNIPNNPFSITQINVGQNNDGYGYTVLEGFKTIQPVVPTNILSIRNTEITNNLKDGVLLDNVVYDNCRIGSKELTSTNKITFLNKQTITNSVVQNINQNDPNLHFDIKSSILDNGYDPSSTLESYHLGPNIVIIKVAYSDFANKELPKAGDIIYISNVLNKLNNPDYIHHEYITKYEVAYDVTYTFGDLVPIQFFVKPEGVSIIPPNLDNDFDFDNIRIHNVNNFRATIKDSVVSNYALENNNISYTRIENSTINGGYYDDIMLINNTINGTENTILLTNPYQILSSDANMTLINAYVKGNGNLISANEIEKVKFENILIFSSTLKSNVIADADCKLNYIEILNNSNKLNENIKYYNNVKYRYNVYNIGVSTYPEGRVSPHVIGNSYQTLPLSINTYAKNYNKVSITNGTLLPNSQVLINNSLGLSGYSMKYEEPNFTKPDPAFPLNTDLLYPASVNDIISSMMSITMTNKYMSITNTSSRNFHIKFDSDSLHMTGDRTNNNTSPIDPEFTGPDRTAGIDPYDLYEIPENYINIIKGNYPAMPRDYSYNTVDLYDQEYEIKKFPDYNNNINNINNIIKMKLSIVGILPIGSPYLNIGIFENGDTITNSAPNRLYNISLLIDDDFVDESSNMATKVPAPFIEIEKFEVLDKNTNNKMISIINQIPRYTSINNQDNNQYAIDNIIDYQDFSKDFKIIRTNIRNLPVDYDQTLPNIAQEFIVTSDMKITIGYWITWNYGEYYTYGAPGEDINNFTQWEFSKRTYHEFILNP